MKLTMMTSLCGPSGNAFKGDPVEVTDRTNATYLIEKRHARPYDDIQDGPRARKLGTLVRIDGRPTDEDMAEAGFKTTKAGNK